MSLYGALFGGVSGLKAQSSKIGVISDNIANVNTVGYKQSEALFETLVVNASSTTSYQTGGVRGESRINVSKQGLLLSTDTPTDVAISGAGFFTVKSKATGTSQPLYTRAGSFRQDNLGNFVNAQGFYLQGWPLDREGRLPGAVGNLNTTSSANLDSLSTVNVESASGVAQATSQIKIGANLDAGQTVYPGEAGTVTLDKNNTLNYNIDAESVIVSAEYNLAPANDIVRGDSFEIVTGNGLNYAYQYGGYTVGRSITTPLATANYGDGLNNNDDTLTTVAVTFDGGVAAGLAATEVRANLGAGHGLIVGDKITINGHGAYGALANLDGTYTITAVTATGVVFNTGVAHGQGLASATPGATVSYSPYEVNGVIFDANSASEAFFGVTGTTRFTTAAKSFTITTATDTHTFTYTASSPNATAGQFNNLNTLADAIKTVSGLTARVANGRLVVAAEDANSSLTFANGDATTATNTQTGIDWIAELDLRNVTTGSRRWNSLEGLRKLVVADDGVTATIENSLSDAVLKINVDDPLDTIRFRDIKASTTQDLTGQTFTAAAAVAGAPINVTLTLGTAPGAAGYTVGDTVVLQNVDAATITALGLPATFPNTPGGVAVSVTAVTTAPDTITFQIPASYNPNGYAGAANAATAGVLSIVGESNQGSLVSELFAEANLKVSGASTTNIVSLNGTSYLTAGGGEDSGILGPQYDSSGVVGDNMASGKIVAQFSRNVRVYDALGAGHDIRYSFIKISANKWAVEVHAIPTTDVSSTLPDGQLAVGTIEFNGDGSLRSVSSNLTQPISAVWTNGAVPGSLTVNWGTAGQPFGTVGATAIGDTDGLSQFKADYNVAFIDQNGAPVGELVSVTINEEGLVIATYTNGETQNLYKLPIAEFSNPNGLKAISGNVFAETRESGVINLREAGTNGVGDVVSGSLEQSNVELSEQLTDLIVAQRAYQSNTRVISATDELLDQLNKL